MNKLSFIGGDLAADPEVTSSTPPAVDAAQSEPERDAQGRFVARDGEETPPAGAPEGAPAETPTESAPAAPPEPSADTPAETPPATPPAAEPGHVPLKTLLDERESRQEAQRREREAADRAAALEQRLAEMEARRDPPPQLEPDQQRALEIFLVRRDMSRDFIATRFGEDTAKTLDDWAAKRCGEDPAFNQQVFAAAKPYEFVKQAYDREQVLATVQPDELADYRAWKEARANPPAADPAPAPAAAAAVAAQPVQAAPAPPPRSLASATGTGAAAGSERLVTVEPGASFRATIPS